MESFTETLLFDFDTDLEFSSDSSDVVSGGYVGCILLMKES